MRIHDTVAAKRAKNRKTSDHSADEAGFTVDSAPAEGAPSSRSAQASPDVGQAATILQLQEVRKNSPADKKIFDYCDDLLHSLTMLQLEMLGDGVRRATLEQVNTLLEQPVLASQSLGVQELMARVQQRAAVELAKIEVAHRRDSFEDASHDKQKN